MGMGEGEGNQSINRNGSREAKNSGLGWGWALQYSPYSTDPDLGARASVGMACRGSVMGPEGKEVLDSWG